ncbi:MAG: hypothetical protein WCJ30_03980, partial [Deltaproteobacteria bacterium]
YALQRVTAETVSRGALVAAWGPFELRHARLSDPSQSLAAWTPVTGWRAAERERDGTVFRWGARRARVSLVALTSAPCVRVRGEARTLRAEHAWSLLEGPSGSPIVRGVAATTWQPFESDPFTSQLDPVTLDLAVTRDEPSDPTRVLALRHVEVVPADTCGEVAFDASATDLAGVWVYRLAPGARLACARALARLAHGAGRVGIRAGDQGPVTWTPMFTPGVSWIASNVFDTRTTSRIELRREPADATPSPVERIRIVPASCANGGTAVRPGPPLVNVTP